MARQEMLMARCDRKECQTVIEIDRSTEAPEGWLEIRVEIEGKYDGRSKMEFCSERCVSIWAKDRNRVVNPRPNGNGTNYRDEVIAAIEILHANDQTEFTKNDITSVAEIDPTTVNTWLRKLKEEGIVNHIGGDGKRHSPFVYTRA